MAATIQAEITRAVTRLLRLLFAERRRAGGMDLEAVEMALRAAMHQAGAAALAQWLRFPEPPTEQRAVPCRCGHQANYREPRARRILTVLGKWSYRVPGICVPNVTTANSPSIANST